MVDGYRDRMISNLLAPLRSLCRAKAAFLVAALAIGTSSFACSNGDNPGTGGGSTGTGGSTSKTYGESACGQCIETQCPLGKTGDVDAGCAKKCQKATTSEGANAEGTVESCRSFGAGKQQCAMSCEENGNQVPLLFPHQICDGSGGAAGTGGSGGSGGSLTPTMIACQACEAKECCQSEAACTGNKECGALSDCIKHCDAASADHAGCQADCAAMHPDGVLDFGTIIGCVGDLCLDQCAGATPDSCVTCSLTGTCGDIYANILATQDGYLLTACVTKCDGDLDCVAQCFDTYPDETTATEEYTDCLSMLCPQCS
jgi:hypothetical protein